MKTTLTLAVLLLFALAACSAPANETENDMASGDNERVATEAAAVEEPAATEEPAAAEESVPVDEALSVSGEVVSPVIESADSMASVEAASAPAATIKNTDHYYHLQTMFLEDENKCLEGNTVAEGAVLDGAAFMDDCSGATGQLWEIVPMDDGYYTLQTKFLEDENKCLEGNTFGSDVLGGGSFMDDCQDVTGQAWKFVESDVEGYYHMQTALFEGENKCLEGNRLDPESVLEGGSFMDDCLNVTGQYWKLVSPHFSYEGEDGPAYWGELGYPTCDDGVEQSPVDIPADAPLNPDDVAYAYNETAVDIVNNGHAIQVNYDEGSTAEIGGTPYELKQFHFHSLSEHTMAGENKDMEMHLVHADADGNNAVIGVMLVEGAENTAFAPVWDNMPAEEGESTVIDGAFVNVDALLPEDRSYYAYNGSLTTPACTEGVLWHVLSQPVEISAEQLAAFRAIHDGTNRPVQPMNDRVFLSVD